MALSGLKRLGVMVSTFPLLLRAQLPTIPDSPRFEVVSIRPVQRGPNPIIRAADFTPVLPGGKFTDPYIHLSSMIAFAYGVKNFDRQLIGLPKWAQTQAYAVAARPPEGFPEAQPGENEKQVRLMVQAMLADRFHLQIRSEIREEQILYLEAAKGGLRIREVDPPIPPAKAGPVFPAIGDSSGRIIGNKTTMAELAAALSVMLGQPVIDRTGLKGFYDLDISWREPQTPGVEHPPGAGTDGLGLLISNLRSQLGLRLSRARGPVEYWVVDHVEPPTPN